MLHQPDTRSLVFAAMSGEGSEPLVGSESLVGVKIPDDAGIAGWVLANRQPLFVDDTAHDWRFSEDIAETVGYVPRRLWAMPLVLENRALGVLEVLDPLGPAEPTVKDQLAGFADEAVRTLGEPGSAE
jgi:GAF domain-containing protein